MKIILIKDTKKVGRKYEVKDVADGFALNSLIPGKFAIPATASNLKIIESKKLGDLSISKNLSEAVLKVTEKLPSGKLVIEGKVNELGHLFAGIHEEKIAEEFQKVTGLEIAENSILIDKAIKGVGEYKIKIKVGDKTIDLLVEVKGTK
ncbi:MAG: 50S ribosomal protein L9 [Candidatus Taylorbacteria bacterium]|nr:50S ribosomal protein L9 [Candidatus Taylorbacteria bacterium]